MRSGEPPCFCPHRRGAGVLLILVTVGLASHWTHSAYGIRVGPGDKTASSPRARSLEETGEEQKESGAGLPHCFSSPEADPSKGEWRSSPNGVDDSPAEQDDWALPPTDFNFLGTCDHAWNRHREPGHYVSRPYWNWEPAECSLAAVNEADFCRAMKGRKGVLLVGDSLTRLSTTTLAAILRAKAVNIGLLGDDWEACGGELKLRFIRNDYLDARVPPHFVPGYCEEFPGGATVRGSRCQVFGTDAILRDFDTLIVNSGAHPRPATQYGEQLHVAAEALTTSMNRLHGKDKAILVVRNTVPGHWGSTERKFDGPINATVAAGLVAEAPYEYQWAAFSGLNIKLQEAFSSDKGWTLLDAYTPTILRADSHIGGRDCLHYCMPGPADHWINLLYNIILAATSSA